MNYGKKHNALCAALVDDLIIAFGRLREQRARVAILRAVKGVGVWSAGHDISELPLHRDPLGWDDPLRHLIREIERFPGTGDCDVEGTVWGGGSETVFACDLVVAAPDVTFAVTPARLGVPYNVSGMLTFLNSADIRIVKEMAFTAKPMSANGPIGWASSITSCRRRDRGVHIGLGGRNRRQRAAEHRGHEGTIADFGRGPDDVAREFSSGYKVCGGSSTTATTTRKASRPSKKSAGRSFWDAELVCGAEIQRVRSFVSRPATCWSQSKRRRALFSSYIRRMRAVMSASGNHERIRLSASAV